MQSRIGQLEVGHSARGIPSYRVEAWHDGLRKHREIKGADSAIVLRKAQLQMAEWDAKWATVSAKAAAQAAREEQKQQHESLKLLAAERSEEAKAELEALEGILHSTLAVDDRIDWERLKDRSPFPEQKPRRAAAPPAPTPKQPPIEPKRGDVRFAPDLGLLDKLVPSRKQKRIHEGKLKFESAHAQWQEAREQIVQENALSQQAHEAALKALEQEHAARVSGWEQRRAAYEAKQGDANAAVDAQRQAYESRNPSAIAEYCDMVLSASAYPDYMPKEWELDYNEETRALVVDYQFPAPTDLPTLRDIKYVQSRGELVESHTSDGQLSKLYDGALYQVALRTVHELFEADAVDALDSVTLNGWVTSIDRATGNEATACVLSLHTNKTEFTAINLSAVDPKACFKALKGVGSSKLHSLTAVAPILNIRREDGRFVAARELASTLDDSVNLAIMDWEDFEHLIREIFQSEFSSSGGEVKVTQASRDGGVDAIAYDPDPIRGGKIVIQAKRYTNTVGVGAVRDLYGTVMNEGATKGILVTTADYGPDAYAFAKDKPLVLLNGANLLHLLEKHGHRARINIKEAREQALRQSFRQ